MATRSRRRYCEPTVELMFSHWGSWASTGRRAGSRPEAVAARIAVGRLFIARLVDHAESGEPVIVAKVVDLPQAFPLLDLDVRVLVGVVGGNDFEQIEAACRLVCQPIPKKIVAGAP